MVTTKQVNLKLDVAILDELDAYVRLDQRCRNDIINEILSEYLNSRRNALLREEMQKGYLEMAAINLSLAREGIE